MVLILAPLSAPQHTTAPRHSAHPATVQAAPPVPEWTFPLFTSEPRDVLAEAARFGAPEDFDAVVLENFVHVQIDSSGRIKQTTRMVTHVLRLQGIAPTRQVRIAWFAWRENRPKIKSRVITADAKTYMLEEATITDTLIPASAGAPPEAHVLTAMLPAVDYDSIVELEVEQSDREPVCPGGRWGEIALDPRTPIFRFTAVFDSDSPQPLLVQARGFAEVSTRETPVTAGHQVTVEAARIVRSANQILLPPDVPSTPVISFSTVKNWHNVAQWCAEAFNSHRETISKALGHSVEDAVLLISKLKAQGLRAEAALVRAAPDTDLLPSQPGFEAFNRVLVYVPGEHARWFDPGMPDPEVPHPGVPDPSAPDAAAEADGAMQLPLADQGRWALIVDPSTSALIRTPESTAQDNRRIDTTEIQLEDGALAKVKTSIETHGGFEEAFPHESAKQANVRESTSEGYAASYVGAAEGFIDLPGPASVNFQSVGLLLDPRAQTEPARKVDYYAFPPFSEETRYHVMLPAGFQFGQLPPVVSMAIGPLTLSASERIEGDGSLSVVYGLVSPKSRYTPQEGAAIRRDAAQKLANQAGFRLGFVNTAEEMLAKGKIKEALELLRQNAGSSVNATLRLADGYLAAGSRAEAVKVCEQVIAKDAKNAAAYGRLGWVYAHNDSGRLYAEGMNNLDAEKALKKAIELNPDNRSYVIQLATLYTYNASGVRFGNGTRLADAIDAYNRAGMQALAASQTLNDLAGSLLFARRYGDVRQFYLNPEADAADPAIKVAAIAAERGANDAREEVAFLSVPQQNKAEMLAHAARYLLLAREYAAAADLGIRDDRLRRAKRFDADAVSAQPAVAAFQRFIQAVLNPAAPELWKKFVVPEAAARPAGDFRSRLFTLLGSSSKAPDAIEWPYIADVLTSTLDFKVEESGDTCTILAGQKTVAHVVKRGNEFLVADLVP